MTECVDTVYIDLMATAVRQRAMEMRITNIDEDLSRRFRALCLMEKKTLGAKLTEMIERELQKKGMGRSDLKLD